MKERSNARMSGASIWGRASNGHGRRVNRQCWKVKCFGRNYLFGIAPL